MNFWKKALSAVAAVVLTAVAAHAISTTAVDRIVAAGTTVPVLSTCGTGALTAGSTDTAGIFSTTGGVVCTVTFGQAFATAPVCAVTELGANLATRTTTVSATSIIIGAGTSGGSYSYICVGKQGG